MRLFDSVRLFFMRCFRGNVLSASLQSEVEQYLRHHYVEPEKQRWVVHARIAGIGESKPESFEPVEIISREELEKYMAENRKVSFGSMLLMLIDERSEKDSDVYKRAFLDRRVFSRIRCDNRYQPSKNTAIRLALSLALDRTNFDELLKTAGFILSNSDVNDLIIAFCVEHKIYDLWHINSILEHYRQPSIF